MIMFRSHNFIKTSCFQILRSFSVPKVSQIPLNYLKSGYINFIRFEEGNELCIVRPQNMNPVPIKPELLEHLHKNNHSYQLNNKIILSDNSSKSVDDLTIDNYESINSSVLDSMSQRLKSLTIKQRFEIYGKLGKLRLTTLVVISSLSGFLMAPLPLEFNTILLASIGTFCTSMGANTINQILEVPYDSQMKRTKNRPLVLGKITPLHATIFAGFCATSGSILLFSCNPLACALGLSNLILYTAIYTPNKRISMVNTWLGSIVGGIPPLIGWAAATGGIHLGGLLISSMLFCWQFPHFMALSWNLKSDYSKAGYQMASIVKPELCKVSALRHSVLISALSCLSPLINLTDWCFLIEIFPFNLLLCFLAYRFYSNPTSSNSRRLFRYTLVYLPILMLLLIINKHSLSSTPNIPNVS